MKRRLPSTIAITGAFGLLGRRLIRLLEADDAVERIVAIDVRSPFELARREAEPTDAASLLAAHPRMSAHTLDLTDPDAGRELAKIFESEGVKAVAHLAFLSNPTHHHDAAHELETIGTLHVLNAAAAANVTRLVSLSSTMCYGARSNSPAWHTEAHPLRGNEESRFLKDKIDAEHQVNRFAAEHPSVACATLRVGALLGGNSRHFWTRYLTRPGVATVLGHDPLFQLLHPNDAAEAFGLALASDAEGAFNIVGRGVLPLSQVVRGLGGRPIPMPFGLGGRLLRGLWSAQLIEMPPGFAEYLRWTWVCDGTRAQEVLGFSPRLSTEDVVALVKDHGPEAERSAALGSDVKGAA